MFLVDKSLALIQVKFNVRINRVNIIIVAVNDLPEWLKARNWHKLKLFVRSLETRVPLGAALPL